MGSSADAKESARRADASTGLKALIRTSGASAVLLPTLPPAGPRRWVARVRPRSRRVSAVRGGQDLDGWTRLTGTPHADRVQRVRPPRDHPHDTIQVRLGPRSGYRPSALQGVGQHRHLLPPDPQQADLSMRASDPSQTGHRGPTRRSTRCSLHGRPLIPPQRQFATAATPTRPLTTETYREKPPPRVPLHQPPDVLTSPVDRRAAR